MFITDKMWEVLEPACKMGDNATRKELEQGIKIGMFKLFKTNNSAMITADHRGVLRIGVAGGNLKDIVKLEKYVIKYAKEKKYKYVDILGRTGWEKMLNGYKKKAILLRKEI